MLAKRLGMTVHCSPLEFKFKRLALGQDVPIESLDEWLVDLANHRGACVVERRIGSVPEWPNLTRSALSDEELVVLICQPQRLDHPQILRLAAQMISRNQVNLDRLILIAKRERADRTIGELARQALRVDPSHVAWTQLDHAFSAKPLRDPIIHWTRLAEPQPIHGVCDGRSWKLVA